VAFLPPTAVLLHPSNFEAIRLSKATTNEYLLSDPMAEGQPTLLGAPVYLTTDITLNTGLVVNAPECAIVYNRQPVTVEASESHADFFQKNIRAFRAGERIGFGVKRPLAAVSVTALN
jgi:HK97 family phage major capsid protein